MEDLENTMELVEEFGKKIREEEIRRVKILFGEVMGSLKTSI